MNVTIVLRRSLESRLAPASGSARTIHALSTQPRTNFFAQPCKCFRNKLGGPGRSSPCIHGTYNDACCAASCLLRRDPHGERRWNSTRDVRPRLESSCEWIWPYLAERERKGLNTAMNTEEGRGRNYDPSRRASRNHAVVWGVLTYVHDCWGICNLGPVALYSTASNSTCLLT